MARLLDIPICILAGGKSKRFGSPKGLAPLGGRPLIEIVRDRLMQQSSAPIILIGDPAGAYENSGLVVVKDRIRHSLGPIAGIYTALSWARENGYYRAATCALDLPLVPSDLLSRLAIGHEGATIAASRGRWHPVVGVWPTKALETMETFIKQGERSAHGWAERCSAQIVEFPDNLDGFDPFENINTIEDLARISDWHDNRL